MASTEALLCAVRRRVCALQTGGGCSTAERACIYTEQ